MGLAQKGFPDGKSSLGLAYQREGTISLECYSTYHVGSIEKKNTCLMMNGWVNLRRVGAGEKRGGMA